MGCLTSLRWRKIVNKKTINRREDMSTVLPEPEPHGPSLQSAPPSFRIRTKPAQLVHQRARPLSAHGPSLQSAPPSFRIRTSLHVQDCDALSSMELDEQEESKGRAGDVKDQRLSNPLPLPLPSPQGSSVLKNMGSFKSSTASGPILTSGPLLFPPLEGRGLRNFSFEEISMACQNFSFDQCVSESTSSSTVYTASFGDGSTGSKKLEATVTRLLPSSQGFKEFVIEVYTLASLEHPQLCKLLGFHAREGSDQRMLVYEKLYHGSLDRLLYGRSEGPSIDWSTRMKVALCAAKGLAFLHDEGPFQAMYNEFSAANIQVDLDFSAKLSGYGCVNYYSETDLSNTSAATANLSVETLQKGLLTPKSNVWSFGIVLLELLTGGKNFDSRHSKEERNIVKCSRPFLTDDCCLFLIMDPRIKGRFPRKAARTVADIVLKCLHKDPSERPTMRAVVKALESVQDMKHPCLFPLQLPTAVTGKPMLKSPSPSGIIPPVPPLNYSPPSPSRAQLSISPPRPSAMSMPPALMTCASTLSVENNRISTIGKLPSSTLRRPGVEGF